ncbi:CPBP family intramembrane glutamic endopeptidase [Streptococcus phocae subsp. salmonis]|uniref:CPBP family intramembrane glutamic endopeptidase n=1 Tax=Streptococcus phocae TaxID=119224 RepID=UPI00053195E1|nr:CPBP family intramembrane glutamic endopeptidase [Streptococcus phocae]KGR73304.1 hypothetical protein NX86_01135 [Streptococcus phocae subsp. salmonis]
MKLLKLLFLIIITILLSLVIQVPIYLGLTNFNNHIAFKILIGVATSLLILGMLMLIRRKYLPNIPVNKNIPVRTILGLVVLTSLLIIGLKLILHIMGIDLVSANNDDIIRQLFSDNLLFMMINLHIFGPFLEETVFRGIFLESLKRLYPNRKYIALLLSSFLFAYTHVYMLSFNLLEYFISGFLYSILYYKSRSLRDSVLAHVLSNVFITILLLITGLLVH